MSSKVLEYKLKQAIATMNPIRIEEVVRECKEAGNDKETYVRVAEKQLQIIEMKSKLEKAVENKDRAAVSQIIDEIASLGISKKMRHDVLLARRIVARKERFAKTKDVILDFGKTMISEIRSYDHPPEIVHRVIQAALMLLGMNEKDSSEWRKCRAFCCQTGANGLNRKIMKFTIANVNPEIKPMTKEILAGYGLAEVRAVSSVAASFYIWARGVIDDLEQKYVVLNED